VSSGASIDQQFLLHKRCFEKSEGQWEKIMSARRPLPIPQRMVRAEDAHLSANVARRIQPEK